MTSERRLLLTPSDIQCLEFVCKKCGVSLTLDPRKEKHFVRRECPNCGWEWLPNDALLHKAVSAMFRAIRTLNEMQAEATFELRLHVKREEV